MGDTETTSTLLLIAGILQIVFSLIFIILGVFLVLLMIAFMMDPFLMMMGPILIVFLIYPVLGVIGLIFAILWFNWRQFPGEHKTGIIVSGILSLLTVGFIPGLLALIAGVIVPSPSEYRGYLPPKTPTTRFVKRCPSCGAEMTGDDDRFCWRCGSTL